MDRASGLPPFRNTNPGPGAQPAAPALQGRPDAVPPQGARLPVLAPATSRRDYGYPPLLEAPPSGPPLPAPPAALQRAFSWQLRHPAGPGGTAPLLRQRQPAGSKRGREPEPGLAGAGGERPLKVLRLTPPEQVTAMMEAAACGRLGELQRMLEAGIPANGANQAAYSVLMKAAAAGQDKAVQLLLQHGARVHTYSSNWESPLQQAVLGGHVEVARRLMEQGGLNLEIQDGKGYTLLMHAAAADDVAMCRLLLEHGARVMGTGSQGDHALLVAARDGSAETVKLLLQAGADPEQANQDGNTALIEAAYLDHAAVAGLLLQAGADGNRRSNLNETPLQAAAARGCVEVARQLLKSHKMSAANCSAALEAAIICAHPALVRLLLDAGAELDLGRLYSYTRLQAAGCDLAMFRLCGAPSAANPHALTPAGLRTLRKDMSGLPAELIRIVIEAPAGERKLESLIMKQSCSLGLRYTLARVLAETMEAAEEGWGSLAYPEAYGSRQQKLLWWSCSLEALASSFQPYRGGGLEQDELRELTELALRQAGRVSEMAQQYLARFEAWMEVLPQTCAKYIVGVRMFNIAGLRDELREEGGLHQALCFLLADNFSRLVVHREPAAEGAPVQDVRLEREFGAAVLAALEEPAYAQAMRQAVLLPSNQAYLDRVHASLRRLCLRLTGEAGLGEI